MFLLSIIMLAVGFILLIAATAIAVPTAVSNHRYRRFIGKATSHKVLRDSHASWIVDRSLRALVQACKDEWRRAPGIVSVVLGTDSITVYLASPSPQPPTPWGTSTDGLVWSASLTDLQTTSVDADTANPYTGLFTIGVSGSGRVFADLDQARGLISIGGDETSRREVARRWIAEASSRTWATGPVLLVGLDGRADPVPTPGIGILDVVALVQSGAPGLVLVEGEPHPEQTARLVRALESVDTHCPVILVGASADARWRFTAHQNGWLTSDFLPDARFSGVPDIDVVVLPDDSTSTGTSSTQPAVSA